MSHIDDLLANYSRFVGVPWNATAAGPQRVWFALYEPHAERRLRLRREEFAIATRGRGHGWIEHDLTDAFPRWMAARPYADAYFDEPALAESILGDFASDLAADVRATLARPDADADTVVALTGIASLFGFAYVSALVEAIAPSIRGRLLVFFPGQRDGSSYRLLDARDGWNYLAIPISATAD